MAVTLLLKPIKSLVMKTVTAILTIILIFSISTLYGQWFETIIDEGLNKPSSFCLNDIDDDGDEDIVAAIYNQNVIIWYENENGSWKENIIDYTSGPVGITIIDLDKDGKKDIIAAANNSNTVLYYHNNGDTPIEFTETIIDNSLLGAEFVYVADFDNDDDNDILATGYIDDMVVWYENDGSSSGWVKDTIGINLDAAIMCIANDIDGDGLTDVMVNAMLGNKLVWFKNNENGKSWTEHIVDNNLPGISEFDLKDIDNDGKLEIIATATQTNKIFYYKNLGEDSVSWNSYLVDDNLGGAFAVEFADMDNDGDMDAVATGKNSGEVVLYTNTVGVTSIDWEKNIIKSGLTKPWEIRTCDADGDGDIDIIINQFISNGNIICYLNPLIPNSTEIFTKTKNFKIYPNPTDKTLNIKIPYYFKNNYTVEISDILGKQVFKNTYHIYNELLINQIDISSFKGGIYIVMCKYKNKVVTQKIVVR